jgi:hypothetical protein
MASSKKTITIAIASVAVVIMAALVLLVSHRNAHSPGHSLAADTLNIAVERIANSDATREFKFKSVPVPASTSAATSAIFSLVTGGQDVNGAGVEKLRFSFLPVGPDSPRQNFFFKDGSTGGRILVDLNLAIDIRQINSYSWHKSDRGPQRYKLYASNGGADGSGPELVGSKDPLTFGWKLLATVDTRPKAGEPGGQYGVSISSPRGLVGHYRYLLFDCKRTEETDRWGNTFYSQIDVISK